MGAREANQAVAVARGQPRRDADAAFGGAWSARASTGWRRGAHERAFFAPSSKAN